MATLEFPEFTVPGPKLESERFWFPASIQDDPWVVYHGTSSFSATSIETSGFDPATTQVVSETVRRAASIISTLCLTPASRNDEMWFHAGMLTSWSSSRISGNQSPVYFALLPQSTWPFFKRNKAGGESAEALRAWLAWFCEFSDSTEMQKRYFDELHAQCVDRVKAGHLPNRPVMRLNANWLQEQARLLRPTLDLLTCIHNQYTNGVVYAVKLAPVHLQGAHYDQSHGLKIRQKIAPSQIIAKLSICDPDSVQQASATDEFVRSLLLLNSETHPLLSALRQYSGTAAHVQTCDAPQPLPSNNENDLGRGAFEGITLSLALEHGTTDVRKWAEQQLALPIAQRMFGAR